MITVILTRWTVQDHSVYFFIVLVGNFHVGPIYLVCPCFFCFTKDPWDPFPSGVARGKELLRGCTRSHGGGGFLLFYFGTSGNNLGITKNLQRHTLLEPSSPCRCKAGRARGERRSSSCFLHRHCFVGPTLQKQLLMFFTFVFSNESHEKTHTPTQPTMTR